MPGVRALAAAAVCLSVVTSVPALAAPHAGSRAVHWVGAWEGAPEPGGPPADNQSYRLLVHTSIAGSTLRLKFANTYGTRSLTLSDVTVALPLGTGPGPAVQASTMRSATFGGAGRVTVPVGRTVYSDPVRFAVASDAWLSVSFYAPGDYPSTTYHANGMTTSYQTPAGAGDHARDVPGSSFRRSTISWTYLSAVDMVAAPRVSTVVALGDSITDCCENVPDSNMRWPDILNRRLAAQPGDQRFSVVNAGISGNNVSTTRDGNRTRGDAGDVRVFRDVFGEPNVSALILFEGINDIGSRVRPSAIVDAYERILRAARARHIRVLVATLTPCFGAIYRLGYTTNAPARNVVNRWIRSHRSRFDGVIDFASVVANPGKHDLWNPVLNIGDQLHPNPHGLQVMADAIPLSLFHA